MIEIQILDQHFFPLIENLESYKNSKKHVLKKLPILKSFTTFLLENIQKSSFYPKI